MTGDMENGPGRGSIPAFLYEEYMRRSVYLAAAENKGQGYSFTAFIINESGIIFALKGE